MSASLSSPPIRPGSAAAWAVALRPKTLWIATIPVIVGTALAFAAGAAIDLSLSILALVASVIVQAISNLQNDVGYTRRGAESAPTRRTGLPRATANGWLTPEDVHRAIVIGIAVTVLLGLPLVMHAGWLVLAMGVASIAGAIGYMGGPRPIAFTPLGELAVFVFFGLIAVSGSVYIQLGAIPAPSWIAAAALGLLAAAVLLVNNYRDHEHDASVGRRTFVVLFGPRVAATTFRVMVLAPYLLAPLAALVARSPWLALPLFSLPRAVVLLREFRSTPPGPGQNALLVHTVMLEVAFGLLLAGGAVVTGLR